MAFLCREQLKLPLFFLCTFAFAFFHQQANAGCESVGQVPAVLQEIEKLQQEGVFADAAVSGVGGSAVQAGAQRQTQQSEALAQFSQGLGSGAQGVKAACLQAGNKLSSALNSAMQQDPQNCTLQSAESIMQEKKNTVFKSCANDIVGLQGLKDAYNTLEENQRAQKGDGKNRLSGIKDKLKKLALPVGLGALAGLAASALGGDDKKKPEDKDKNKDDDDDDEDDDFADRLAQNEPNIPPVTNPYANQDKEEDNNNNNTPAEVAQTEVAQNALAAPRDVGASEVSEEDTEETIQVASNFDASQAGLPEQTELGAVGRDQNNADLIAAEEVEASDTDPFADQSGGAEISPGEGAESPGPVADALIASVEDFGSASRAVASGSGGSGGLEPANAEVSSLDISQPVRGGAIPAGAGTEENKTKKKRRRAKGPVKNSKAHNVSLSQKKPRLDKNHPCKINPRGRQCMALQSKSFVRKLREKYEAKGINLNHTRHKKRPVRSMPQ